MSAALTTFVVLGGFSLVSCKIDITNKTPVIKPESLELVNVIKEDLRKDNDDYAEHLPRMGAPRSAYLNFTMKPAAATAPAPTPAPTPISLDQQAQFKYAHHLEDTRRQGANPPRGQQLRILTSSIISKAVHNANSPIRQKPSPTKQYPKKPMTRVTVDKDKADKLKMFIQENSGKLQELVKKRKAQAGMKRRSKSDTSDTSDTSETDAKEVFELPSAAHLDMAPAVGAHIESMRMKGHLCFRNVMMPEGPKYDSKGRVYVQAHGAAPRARAYPHTEPPNILLPKCCNCCKKSVLGCE